MATVWRVLKWMLLAWATVSLLGIATLAGLAWWSHRQYQQHVTDTAAPASPERHARELVDGIWHGQDAFVSLTGRHVVTTDRNRRLVVTAVRVQPSALRPPVSGESRVSLVTPPSAWQPGDRTEPMTGAALGLITAQLQSPMQVPPPAWMPSAAQLRGGAFRVEVIHLAVSSGSLDALTLYALRPADNTLFVFEHGWDVQ